MKLALTLILIALALGVWNFIAAETYDGRSLLGGVLLVLAGIRIFTLPDPDYTESESDRDL